MCYQKNILLYLLLMRILIKTERLHKNVHSVIYRLLMIVRLWLKKTAFVIENWYSVGVLC